jgi:hypothetical protein
MAPDEARAHGIGGIDPEVVASFRERGWVLTRSLDADGVARLRAWVDEVASWPDDDGDWMHHRELTDAGPALCRSENLIPHHAGLRELLTEGAMPAVAGALLGEPAVLYKEKVNYKLPGRARLPVHRPARVLHGRRRRCHARERLPRGGHRRPPRHAAH